MVTKILETAQYDAVQHNTTQTTTYKEYLREWQSKSNIIIFIKDLFFHAAIMLNLSIGCAGVHSVEDNLGNASRPEF